MLLSAALLAISLNAQAFQAERDRIEKQQAELDQACEAARQKKLEPIRAQAFNECMNAKRDIDTAADGKRKTSGLNSNRYGSSPLFYDLPPCEDAFRHRKRNPRVS